MRSSAKSLLLPISIPAVVLLWPLVADFSFGNVTFTEKRSAGIARAHLWVVLTLWEVIAVPLAL